MFEKVLKEIICFVGSMFFCLFLLATPIVTTVSFCYNWNSWIQFALVIMCVLEFHLFEYVFRISDLKFAFQEYRDNKLKNRNPESKNSLESFNSSQDDITKK